MGKKACQLLVTHFLPGPRRGVFRRPHLSSLTLLLTWMLFVLIHVSIKTTPAQRSPDANTEDVQKGNLNRELRDCATAPTHAHLSRCMTFDRRCAESTFSSRYVSQAVHDSCLAATFCVAGRNVDRTGCVSAGGFWTRWLAGQRIACFWLGGGWVLCDHPAFDVITPMFWLHELRRGSADKRWLGGWDLVQSNACLLV